jgi:hypothetical protein
MTGQKAVALHGGGDGNEVFSVAFVRQALEDPLVSLVGVKGPVGGRDEEIMTVCTRDLANDYGMAARMDRGGQG